MPHVLPPASHPAREMFDVADLVAIGTGRQAPIFLPQAKRQARQFFADAGPAARRVIYIVLNASTDVLELVSVGRRGGHRVEWRFGPLPRQAVRS